jgi:hypothetical protein
MRPDAPYTRREVVQKAIYATPIIVTLPVLPSFAASGSDAPKFKDDKDKDKGRKR